MQQHKHNEMDNIKYKSISNLTRSKPNFKMYVPIFVIEIWVNRKIIFFIFQLSKVGFQRVTANLLKRINCFTVPRE